jgi:dTDP-4-amino-4,6-dideoxygalactose transaminase
VVNVTKTYFPELSEYVKQLERIWQNQWLTNRGELVRELEDKLKSYLQVDNIIIMNNGTIPIQIALKLLGNMGEIITTPFSYVATTSSILWENCKPVFVDIDPEYLTIDETRIEAAITSKTQAILATHVFGNPCNVESIEQIARKHNIKVIYDAAHCFGVKYKGRSVFSYGDVSTCSFHATKIFHTGEGGAVFCNDKQLIDKFFYSHNFGHNGPLEFYGLGINGKISELQGAMGLAVLEHMEKIFHGRRKIVEYYDNGINFDTVNKMRLRENTEWNYSYYPLIFQSEKHLLTLQKKLNELNIFPRRYFYPSLNSIPFVSGASMPISEEISKRIFCMPLCHHIEENILETIVNSINLIEVV